MNDEKRHDDAAVDVDKNPSEEDANVSFFNPWDQHLNEDFRAALNKFEFGVV